MRAVLAVEQRPQHDAERDDDERRDPRSRGSPSSTGASPRRADTTNATTAMIDPRSNGFVVRVAAVAMPSAQIHHATGWSSRGRRSSPVMGVLALAAARSRARRRRGRRPRRPTQ